MHTCTLSKPDDLTLLALQQIMVFDTNYATYLVIHPITEIVIVATTGADLLNHRQTIARCPLSKIEEVQRLHILLSSSAW